MNNNRGFSFLEFSILISIMIVLAIFLLPANTDTQALNLNSQVNRLISDIRFIQSAAVANHQSQSISFSASSYTLSVPYHQNAETTISLHNAGFISTPSTLIFNAKGESADSVTITMQTANGSECKQISVNVLGKTSITDC